MPRTSTVKNILKGGLQASMDGATEFATETANQAMEALQDPTVLVIGGISIIIIIIIIVAIVKSAKQKKNAPYLIGNPISGSKAQMIKGKNLPISPSHEYSINFWIFCRDWSYNYGKPKCVLYKGDPNCNHVSPMVFLYPKTNNLMIRFSTEANRNHSMNPFKCSQGHLYDPVNSCDVTNIPIQRWVQVSIVLWNTTTDVYINGKLARSCAHMSIPLKMEGSNFYIAQGGGFNGYISKLQYFNYAIDALTSYKLYMKGPKPKKFLGLGKVNGLCGSSDDDEDDEPGASSTPSADAFVYSESGSCS